jgi:hypothetical protein
MDDFGIALPAFAQSTPVADVKVGDIIYSGKTRITWVIEVNADKGNFRVMKPNGESTTWTPPKVSMLGFESGVMVLRSLMSMLPNGDKGLGQMQNMLMPMMMMGGLSGADGEGNDMMEKMMPLMLMGQMNGGTDSGGMGNMMQTMMMMKMMGGDNHVSDMFGGSKKKSPFN